jgi:hypothetical protein
MTNEANTRPQPRPLRIASAGLAALLLAACTPGGGGLSGTYEAKDQNGSMTLEFKSGGKVHLIMQQAGGQPDASDGDYLINGNNVTVQVPGGMPLTLVKNGKTLDANMMGQIMHFAKK